LRSSNGSGKKKARRSRPTVVVGWNEFIDLPEWGVRGLRAKLDTGARSSALHVDNLLELPGERVRFDVVLDRNGSRQRVIAAVTRRAKVRSSTGRYTRRIFVRTVVRIGPLDRPVELSLVDRERMVYRMLIGRSTLSGHYLLDVGSQCLHGRPDRTPKRRN
jgi:hypothetical protein